MNLSSADLSGRFTGALKSARIAVNTVYSGYAVGGGDDGGDGVAGRWRIGKLNRAHTLLALLLKRLHTLLAVCTATYVPI